MKDIELIDHTLGRIAQAGDMEIEIEARDLERICKLALEQVKNCSIPFVVWRSEQLKAFLLFIQKNAPNYRTKQLKPDQVIKAYIESL